MCGEWSVKSIMSSIRLLIVMKLTTSKQNEIQNNDLEQYYSNQLHLNEFPALEY